MKKKGEREGREGAGGVVVRDDAALVVQLRKITVDGQLWRAQAGSFYIFRFVPHLLADNAQKLTVFHKYTPERRKRQQAPQLRAFQPFLIPPRVFPAPIQQGARNNYKKKIKATRALPARKFLTQ